MKEKRKTIEENNEGRRKITEAYNKVFDAHIRGLERLIKTLEKHRVK